MSCYFFKTRNLCTFEYHVVIVQHISILAVLFVLCNLYTNKSTEYLFYTDAF